MSDNNTEMQSASDTPYNKFIKGLEAFEAQHNMVGQMLIRGIKHDDDEDFDEGDEEEEERVNSNSRKNK